MTHDPASGGEQPGWQGQQPYPGGSYGQHGDPPPYPGSSYPPPNQPGGYGQAPPPWAPPGPGQHAQPGGQRWQGGSPAHPAGLGPGGMAPQDGAPSFFNALLDLGFNSFATPFVIKTLYIIGLVGIALVFLFLVIAGFSVSAGAGLAAVVGGAIFSAFYVIFFRVTLEFRYAMVRMAEDIRVLRNRP
jgi:hypothetical protein